VAAYLAVNTGAFLAACELGIQPWIYRDAPGASYFPFPLEVSIPAIMLPHLTAVGALEAVITGMVLLALNKKNISMPIEVSP
jgi:cobalt/nickel transport system permease protein